METAHFYKECSQVYHIQAMLEKMFFQAEREAVRGAMRQIASAAGPTRRWR